MALMLARLEPSFRGIAVEVDSTLMTRLLVLTCLKMLGWWTPLRKGPTPEDTNLVSLIVHLN